MANQHVVTDRTTAQKYAIKVDDERLFIQTTADADQGEPIIEDDVDTGTYFTVFVDNARLSIESVVTVQDDTIDLDDATSGNTYRLVVREGRLAIQSTTVTTRSVFITAKAEIVYNISKINYSDNVAKANYSDNVAKWIR